MLCQKVGIQSGEGQGCVVGGGGVGGGGALEGFDRGGVLE